MFDSHCHLDAEEYDVDRDEVLARASAAGITGIMVPGYEPREWQRLASLCQRDRRVVCAVGLHPLYLHELSSDARSEALAALPDWLTKTGALAVGEFGLDALVAKQGGLDLDAQCEVVRAHLALPRELALPVIVHCVRAHGRMLELLDHFGPLTRGGVLHAYGGPAELIRRYARLNFRFSFGGIVTHPRAKRPRAALAAVPRELLLVETDGPSQVPAGSLRARSEPSDVAQVLEVAAELRGEPLALLARATSLNACALFGCDPARFAPHA
ncbi:MAG: hydrolase TatD [Myxococcaceae bacterium]|nr:hydrolase TatD [Myxococcaceae bacterium]